jgi:putative component of toxin-antitoxin plasmid stabilization module
MEENSIRTITMEEISIRALTDKRGHRPFKDWLSSLRDKTAENGIEARLARLRTGNFGDIRAFCA